MLKLLIKFWPGIFLFFIILLFFYRLFFPLSVFINPDIGRSDLLHFNIPLHKAAWDAMRAFEIPFWEPSVGQGFPLIGEGQVGFFYLPNLVLFGLLPFWIAFNFGYVFTFFLAAVGTYFFARSLSIGKVASTLAAVTYAFSPILILRLHHYNFIQAASIFPLELWAINSFFQTKRYYFLGIFSIILSQQIFAGFQQITLYSLIGVFIFFVYKTLLFYKKRTIRTKALTSLVLATIFSLAIASIQLTSTLTLIKESARLQIQTPQKILSDFPFNPQNLLTIFNPFALGDVSKGTYPKWSPGLWGIFWENNVYFGIVQLVLIASLAILYIKTKEKRKNAISFFFILGFLGLLISLGKFGPFHPVFSIPPISFFRVPSRFLIFTFLAAAMLSAFALEIVFKQKRLKQFFPAITAALLLLCCADIFRVWFNYPLITPVKNLDKEPTFEQKIAKDARIASFGQTEAWNEIYFKKGWRDQAEEYLFFTNVLDQNMNILYERKNIFVYAAMSPRRVGYIESLIKAGMTQSNESLALNQATQNLLFLSAAEYLTSPRELKNENLSLIETAQKNNAHFFLYKNNKKASPVYFVNDFEVASSFEKILETLSSKDFNPENKVILEKNPQIEPSKERTTGSIGIIEKGRNKIRISSNLNRESIVVLSDSFYPGWKATIDGKTTEILAANINSRATVVPPGEHVISYSFEPKGLKLSAGISIAALFALILSMLKFRKATF